MFSSVANFLGVLTGLTVGGVFVYSAFKSEAGFDFLKKIALLGVILGSLTLFSSLVDIDSYFLMLVDLFSYLKGSMMLFDFVIDVPFIFSIVGLFLSILSLYWSFLLVNFIAKFFKNKY